jgi:repressor LexA
MAETPLLHRHLTRVQAETLRMIDAYHDGHGYPPTVREVQEVLRLAAVSSAFSRLETLRRYGLIEWEDGQFRTLRLTDSGHAHLNAL